MLLAEYDYATDIEVQREEAMRIGEEQGEYQKALVAAKNALGLDISPETVSKITGLSLEEIENL